MCVCTKFANKTLILKGKAKIEPFIEFELNKQHSQHGERIKKNFITTTAAATTIDSLLSHIVLFHIRRSDNSK